MTHAAKQTKNPIVARIANRTDCQWPSRSFKVHLIWKGVCNSISY